MPSKCDKCGSDLVPMCPDCGDPDVGRISRRCVDLEAKTAKVRRDAYEEGLRAFAWWKDGVQYVGSCGTTLADAIRELDGKGSKP